MRSLNIVFMGTPDFAVPPLKALHESGHNIQLVVTQPDRPKGRGKKLMSPPVKETALHLGYEVIQPDSVKTDDFFERLSSLKPDVFVVVAYGHILPERILNIPAIGPVNIHASLLPKYRGSAPIQRAIIDGEEETGVTTMFMDKGMDTGDILLMEKTPVKNSDTSESLHDRLSDMGAGLIVRTLSGLADNSVKPAAQDHEKATYAPMLKKQDGRINWNMSCRQIDAFIRGMTPWPGAFTFYNDKRLKIFKVEQAERTDNSAPGTVLNGFSEELKIATGDGALSIREIQGASGKKLDIKDFLRGFSIKAGEVLS